jgi:hypothetical protein
MMLMVGSGCIGTQDISEGAADFRCELQKVASSVATLR